jgi:hypothetical protein
LEQQHVQEEERIREQTRKMQEEAIALVAEHDQPDFMVQDASDPEEQQKKKRKPRKRAEKRAHDGSSSDQDTKK